MNADAEVEDVVAVNPPVMSDADGPVSAYQLETQEPIASNRPTPVS